MVVHFLPFRNPAIQTRPSTTHPVPSQTVSTTKQKSQLPKRLPVDSDHYYEPNVIETNPYDVPRTANPYRNVPRTAKKPMVPAKPKSVPSDGVYMALNPATMGSCQPSQDTQYMPLSDATRRGGVQDPEAPQYVNCQMALGNRRRPTETAKL